MTLNSSSYQKQDFRSQGQVVIETEHERIHDSVGYIFSNLFESVDDDANADILLANPADNFPHLRYYKFVSTKAPCLVRLYEAVITSNDGTAIAVFNCNRNSSNAANLLAYHSPTITDLGTELPCILLEGTKQSGGSIAEGLTFEYILKPEMNYLLRCINKSGQSAGFISFESFFYEPRRIQ